jgi:hypothetical protein
MPITTNLSGLVVGGVSVNAVGSYSWNENRTAIDCTEIGTADSSYIHGLRNCTMSFDVFYLEASHTAFEGFIGNIQSTATTFVITHTTGDTLEGSGFVTGFSVTANAGDVIRATFSLQVSGSVTRT